MGVSLVESVSRALGRRDCAGCSTCAHLRIERVPADALGIEVSHGYCIQLLQNHTAERVNGADHRRDGEVDYRSRACSVDIVEKGKRRRAYQPR